MGKDSKIAAVYGIWIRNIARNLIIHRVPKEVLNSYLKTLQIQLNLHLLFDSSYPSLERICDNPTTVEIETCADLVSNSFIEACIEANGRTWGEIHEVIPEHIPFSKVPLLNKMIGIKQNSGGLYHTIHSMQFSWSEDFITNHTPSAKFVVDLGDVTENYWCLETGQSGHPFSRHYDDMFKIFHTEDLIQWTYGK